MVLRTGLLSRHRPGPLTRLTLSAPTLDTVFVVDSAGNYVVDSSGNYVVTVQGAQTVPDGGGGDPGPGPNDIISPFDVSSVIALWENESLGADGTGVASWTDSKGSNHLTQATGANQPTVDADFFTTSAGTFKGAVFDGVNDLLSSPNLALSGTDDAMLYIVYADLSDGSARSVVAELGPNYEANTNAFGLTQEIGHWPMFGNRGTSTAQTRKVGRSQIVNPTTPKIFACRIDRQMKYGTATPFVNGKNESLPVTQSSFTTGGNFGALPLNIGAREGSGTNALWSNIVVLEAAVANTRHVTQTLHGLVSYWGDKFGIDIPPCYGTMVFDGDSWWDGQGTELVVQSDAVLRRLDQSAGVWDVVDVSVSGHTWANSNADVTTQVDPYVWTGKSNIVLSDLGHNDIVNSRRTEAQVWADAQAWYLARASAGWTHRLWTTGWIPNENTWVLSDRATWFATGLAAHDSHVTTNFIPTYGDAYVDYRNDPNFISHTAFNDLRTMLADNTHWTKVAHYRMADAVQAAFASLGVAFRAVGPSTYATPVSWLKADAGLSLADGDPVSSWANQGSSGVAATSSGSARPTYRTNQQNSLPGLVFDGTDDFLTISALNLSGTKQVTVMSCFGNVPGTGAMKIHEATANTDSGNTTGFYIERSNQLNMQAGMVGNVGSARNTTANPYAITRQAGTFAGAFDKRLPTNQTTSYSNMNLTGSFSPNNVNTNTFGNDTHYLGMRFSGSASKFTGTLFEDLVYDVALEQAEIFDIAHAFRLKYNLTPQPWLADFLTDTPGNTLQTHAPQYGTSWTRHGSYSVDAVFTDLARIRNNGGTGTKTVYYSGVAPDHGDQYVSCTVVMRSNNAESIAGVVFRCATGTDDHYRAVYSCVDAKWHLVKRVAGVDTELGTAFAQTLTVDQEYTVTGHVRAGSLYLYVDGTPRFSAISDSAISATGRVGVYLEGAATNTTGVHLAHISAYPFYYGP